MLLRVDHNFAALQTFLHIFKVHRPGGTYWDGWDLSLIAFEKSPLPNRTYISVLIVIKLLVPTNFKTVPLDLKDNVLIGQFDNFMRKAFRDNQVEKS